MIILLEDLLKEAEIRGVSIQLFEYNTGYLTIKKDDVEIVNIPFGFNKLLAKHQAIELAYKIISTYPAPIELW